jgi:release factor glutamine methyltransferase
MAGINGGADPRGATLRESAAAVARRFREAGIETADLDARLLLCHMAGLSHEAYVAKQNAPLTDDAADRLAALVERRLAGEPVSRLLGVREFFGRLFRIDRHTLDPRPDTETLIEAALELVGMTQGPLDILDLGTGSGAILVTLLAELSGARGVGTDICGGALAVASANAAALGVAHRAQFIQADWLDGVKGTFDLVVSNPPYIASPAIGGLSPEVRLHDPLSALDGGADGLDAYRRIAASARNVLRPGGFLLLEIGLDQGDSVLSLLHQAGFALNKVTPIRRDLAGRSRVAIGQA